MDAQQIAKILIRDRNKLHGFIWGILRDHHLSEDVFQEVTTLAIDRATELNDEQHVLKWSRKAARLKCMEMQKRRVDGGCSTKMCWKASSPFGKQATNETQATNWITCKRA